MTAETTLEPAATGHDRRPLPLADLLVITAGVAISVAIGSPRAVLNLGHHFRWPFKGAGMFEPLSAYWWEQLGRLLGPGEMAMSLASDLLNLALTILMPATATLLVIRLLKPRPAPSDLLCRPGFSACAAALLGTLLIPAGWWYFQYEVPFELVPASVAIAWTLLVATGRWHPERSWVDRAGRAFGYGWLSMLPLLAWMELR